MSNETSVWPGGRQCGITVTVNFDAESVDLHETTSDNLFGKFSYGRYGMRAGVWRLLDVFKAQGLKVTFFVPALDAQNNARAIDAILAGGHEIAARGFAFEDHSTLGDKERETLMRAHEALTKAAGRAPSGWRAPLGMMSPMTLTHLAELGYLYDSSMQDDDLPYVMKTDSGREIVELPQYQMFDDSSLYAPRHSHRRVLKTWKEEFDASYREGTLVNLTLHPRGDHGSGRAARARVVEEFLNYAARHPGVHFATCREMAEAWKKAHPESEPAPV